MIVDFDPVKDAANREKHGVPLGFGALVFEDGNHVVLASFRPVDGEDWYKAVGLVAGRLWTVVYVERGEMVRFISVRRSHESVQGSYHRHSGRSE